MDLSFFRRAEERFARHSAARPDFGMLVAALRTQQATSTAARAQEQAGPVSRLADPIAELLLGGPCWREARATLRGSFNAALARQRGVN